MTGITWLHLSDWHQKGENLDIDREVVREALIDDIRNREQISKELKNIDFIVFSGDVAFSGKKEEYETARKYFFDEIMKAAGLCDEKGKPLTQRLFIVPGNHDLDRDAFELLPDKILKSVEKPEQVEELKQWLQNGRKRARLREPFEEYRRFVSIYTGQWQPDYASIRRFKIKDKNDPDDPNKEIKVALLGINSALMCARRKNLQGEVEEKGFLTVGEPQIRSVLKQIERDYVRIATLHHPLDWLFESDRDQIESLLRRHFQFILWGHEHRPKFFNIETPSTRCLIIPAGASYNRRSTENIRYANAYNFVHLEVTTQQNSNTEKVKVSGKGTIYFRRWSDESDPPSWIQDLQIAAKTNGEHKFNLPQRSIKLPLPTPKPPIPQPLETHYTRLIEKINEGLVVPFLGADINLCDRPEDEQGTSSPWDWNPDERYPPTSVELAAYLGGRQYLQDIRCPFYEQPEHNFPSQCPIITGLVSRMDLPHVSQYFNIMIGPRELRKKIRNISREYTPNCLHKLLAKLFCSLSSHSKDGEKRYPLLVTTNFDCTLEKAFKEAKQAFDLVFYKNIESGISDGEMFVCQRFDHEIDGDLTTDIVKRNEAKLKPDIVNKYPFLEECPTILKLYALPVETENTGKNFTITEDNFINYWANSKLTELLPTTLVSKLTESYIWFLGYSLSYWNQRVILNRLSSAGIYSGKSCKWRAIHSEAEMLDKQIWAANNVDFIYLKEYRKPLSLENYVAALEDRLREKLTACQEGKLC